ncbi:MAG: aldehyde ferredoxin oxidoreductase family protein [Marinilabiliales bacterium]
MQQIDNKPIYKVLYIDLSKKKFWIEIRQDLIKYIGGTGIASKLLSEECPNSIDAFSPENPIIFAVGPLTGVYPLASKTVVMFKSPLTGNIGESHAGGRSAVSIRLAGYMAIVIRGVSDIPVYLSIHSDRVEFKNATTLWGMSSSMTAGKIIRENESGKGFRSIMRIGQAGENLLYFASVTTDTYRHFGRLGLGAVFGSKKLKGIAVTGNKGIIMPDKKEFKKLYDEIYNKAVETSLMQKYHDLGTAGNVAVLNELNALPIKNLKESTNPEVKNITGEAFAEKYLGRRVACSHCPVACIHLGTLREASEHEKYFYKTTMVGYDYELIFALGSMLGIFNPEDILKIIDLVEIYGMDAMSIGNILSWLTEAYENKIITENDTMGLIPEWGNVTTYMQLLDNIVKKTNEFYSDLAKGVYYASQKYGGKEYAMNFGKNEMPGYHSGPAAYLGFTLGTRHSHLDNAGYSIDQSDLIHEYIAPDKIVDSLIQEESFRQILSSLVICFFARGIYNKEIILNALKTVGISIDEKTLLQTGLEIYKMKYKFKFQEGFKFDINDIPERIFETKDPTGLIKKEYISEALKYADKKIKSMLKQ